MVEFAAMACSHLNTELSARGESCLDCSDLVGIKVSVGGWDKPAGIPLAEMRKLRERVIGVEPGEYQPASMCQDEGWGDLSGWMGC